jgi:hypothetical protein
MTKPESEVTFTITLKGHPVNAWFLRLAASGYAEIDDGSPVKLDWNATNKFRVSNPGVHEIHFKLRYFDKVTTSSRTFRPRVEDGDSFTIVNGWSNQHPFTLERDHA